MEHSTLEDRISRLEAKLEVAESDLTAMRINFNMLAVAVYSHPEFLAAFPHVKDHLDALSKPLVGVAYDWRDTR